MALLNELLDGVWLIVQNTARSRLMVHTLSDAGLSKNALLNSYLALISKKKYFACSSMGFHFHKLSFYIAKETVTQKLLRIQEFCHNNYIITLYN